MRLAFAIGRPRAVDATWTTVHLARAALARRWRVQFIELSDFEVDDRGRLLARCHTFDGTDAADAASIAAALVGRTARRTVVDARDLDLLVLRSSPLSPRLLAFARLAELRGVPVVNDPAGLLEVGHKAWLAALPEVATPLTVVTGSLARAQLFRAEHGRALVVKPARGSGGRGVTLVPRGPYAESTLDAAFARAREAGDGHVVVQECVGGGEGEKRLVWLDGAVIGGYLRRRKPGEFRHNLKQGATAHPTDITATDRARVAALAGPLQAAGVRLAGIDLLGGMVLEVNALNPGGAYHADRLHGTRLADRILDQLAAPEPVQPEDRWAHRAP